MNQADVSACVSSVELAGAQTALKCVYTTQSAEKQK